MPTERILRPFQEFAKVEASGSILLLLGTVVALAWANSPWARAYFSLWQTKLAIGLGGFVLAKPLLSWINDGLMAVFFFIVGLEIKREVLVGALASRRRAALPLAAALGGMLVPAGLYLALNAGGAGASGWGIPMATDIAFALGVLTLLGNRIPSALKVFLTALAITDDIGAVLVIALFYTAGISWTGLAIGAGFLIALVAANRAGARHPLVYGLLGIGLWLALLKSGIHATAAGVLVAMTIPARARIDTEEFLARSRAILGRFERAGRRGEEVFTIRERQAAVQALESTCEHAEAPLQRLERALHPWVTFAILPLFALANAGVALGGHSSSALAHSVSLGVIVGLVVGKPLGITLFAWLAVRSGLAAMPTGVTWRGICGVGWLGGIGFTMSLFIAGLAFGDIPLLSVAKVGILAASLIAGVVGWMFLRGTGPAAGKGTVTE
ncbi:MAG: Na+/H+ antiporter NhaA [Candidatus Bipolaricaulia bacterium]